MKTITNSPFNAIKKERQWNPSENTLDVISIQTNTDFFSLLKAIVESPRPGGYNSSSMKEIRMRIKLIDVISDAITDKKESIELEDAQFEALKEAYKNWNWGIISKDVLKFDEIFNEEKN